MNVKVVQSSPRLAAAKTLAADSKAPPVAVLVCHGMGQQVHFETISAVAQAIETAAANQENRPENDVSVEIIQVGQDQFPRAELNTSIEGIPTSIHIYEAYWAPLTEGKVTLRDVYYFLKDAAFGAFWNCAFRGGEFERYLFGGFKRFFVPVTSLVAVFGFALVVLWSLALINSVITVVAAGRVLTGAAPTWPSNQLLSDLTLDFVLLLGCAAPLALGYAYVLSLKTKRERAEPLLNVCLQALIWITLVAIVLVALLVLGQLVADRNGTPHSVWEVWLLPLLFSPEFARTITRVFAHPVTVTLVWSALIWLSFKARWFLIQYVGDVAAYISAHTVNKFYELREDIQQTALKVARAVYSQSDGSNKLYSRVLVVGHSLGSVVAYDTLNALIIEERLNANGLHVVERTGSLITFGSPLDKTAFIFRNQKSNDIIREGLAAAVQPLIEDASIRTRIDWLNIYSPQDWISGSLEFYDNPGWPVGDPRAVRNLPDLDAVTPLLAHTEYWTNELLGKELLAALVRQK